jgi:hypothetical protein
MSLFGLVFGRMAGQTIFHLKIARKGFSALSDLHATIARPVAECGMALNRF